MEVVIIIECNYSFYLQFNSIMSVIKEMVSYVEAEHKTKLEQLNSIRQEHG